MIKIKKFDELTLNELYDILNLRAEIFVVDQNCPYNDVDGKDKNSVHFMIWENDKLEGYIRVIKPGISYDSVSIGRVIVRKSARHKGYAKKLLISGIEFITNEWNENKIEISAQTYLENFYKSLNFKTTSDVYLEDEIPHVHMIFEKN